MENDDTRIIAISLGIPSATLLSIALILAIRFHYRPLWWIEAPNPPPQSLPIKQNPPMASHSSSDHPESSHPYHADWSWSMTSLESRREGRFLSEETSPVIPERRPPTPPRRCMPIIVITSTGSANSTPYVPWTPSPGTYAQFTEDNRGFDVGCDIRPVTPTTSYDPWADRNAATAPAAEDGCQRVLG